MLVPQVGLRANPAPTYLGPSGLIFSPDDTVACWGTANMAYRGIFSSDIVSYWAVNAGILKDVEAGIGGTDDHFPHQHEGTRVLLNAKWRIVPETEKRVGVAVGVADTLNQLKGPSVYFAVCKDIGPMLFPTHVPDSEVRLSAGYGSGFFKNGFIGLQWTMMPRLQLMAEYVGTQIPATRDTGGNFGLRYEVFRGFKVDADLIDFQRLGIGFSYTTNASW